MHRFSQFLSTQHKHTVTGINEREWNMIQQVGTQEVIANEFGSYCRLGKYSHEFQALASW